MDLSSLGVAIASGAPEYPSQPPFDPPVAYPELPYATGTDSSNGVYSLVRETMRLLSMDASHFGTQSWNPLGEIIASGDRVLIKPNFVADRNYGTGPLEAVTTHPSVLRAIVDYVLIALGGRGELLIGDAPQMNCQWSKLLSANGIGPLCEHLKQVCGGLGIPFTLMDFRIEETEFRFAVVWKRKALLPPEGRTVKVDLGSKSFMEQIDSRRLYGADYRRSQIVEAHRNHRHEYRVARQVLEAQVVISVPKLKVHSKVGTTLNIKNLVGINTDKNHLAHYRIGPQSKGGDEFSDPHWDDLVDRWLSDFVLGKAWRVGKYFYAGWRGFRKLLRRALPREAPSFVFGNWFGNDTAWRMALDMNRVVLTVDRQGQIQKTPQRKYFSFIDGIVGGQGDGPLSPDAYPSGVIVAGANPVAVDWTATRLMGLDPGRIPMYSHAPDQMREWVRTFSIEEIEVCSSKKEWCNLLLRPDDPVFHFAPAPGWRGHVEAYSDDGLAQNGKVPPKDSTSPGERLW